MKAATTADLRVLRLKDVQDRIGVGRSTIYDLINPRSARFDATFPRPIKLGAVSIGWVESELAEWIYARMGAREGRSKH